MGKFHYFYTLLLIFYFYSCEPIDNSGLPRALTPEEVKSYFPKSEPIEINAYEQSLRENGLLDVQSLDDQIFVHLKYSTTDNFFGKDVYGTLELAYLQPEVAKALVKANQNLKKHNKQLRLLVYDAARPNSVQKVLWDGLDSLSTKERKNYVADPEVGSIHNYGCAVDLTIYNMETKKPLDMGTPFDYFGDLAYPRLERQMLNEGKLSLEQLNNRILLRTVMEQVGFKHITSEWWHFNFLPLKEAKMKYTIIP